MKTNALILSLFLMLLVGCQQIEDLFTKKISTTLTVSQTVTVTTQSQVTKSAGGTAATYVFSSSKDLSLNDNTDVNDYLNKIKSISIESATAQFLNLQSGQEILTLSVKVDGTEVFSKTNITSANSAFVPTISAANLSYIATKLSDNKKINVSLSGTTNYPNMTFGATFGFATTFEVKIL